MGRNSLVETSVTDVTKPAGIYPDKKPINLVVSVAFCIFIAVIIQFVLTFLINFSVWFHNDFHDSANTLVWNVPARPLLLFHLALIHVVLLFLSWRLAFSIGRGSRLDGLGLAPIRHPGILFCLSILVVPLVGAWVAFLLHLGLTVRVSGLAILLEGDGRGSALTVPMVALVVVGLLAPLSEEAIFRGWLWVGLRRHWGVLPVASLTGFLWLLVHTPEGFNRTLFLLPLGVILSAGRALCGSMRASMLLHMLNNLAFGGYAILMSF